VNLRKSRISKKGEGDSQSSISVPRGFFWGWAPWGVRFSGPTMIERGKNKKNPSEGGRVGIWRRQNKKKRPSGKESPIKEEESFLLRNPKNGGLPGGGVEKMIIEVLP